MCGRYQLIQTQDPRLQKIWGKVGAEAFRPGEVFPSTRAPVLIAQGEKIQAVMRLWGIPGGQKGFVINARAETVLERPMFREGIHRRRCAVPTTGFYEWDSRRHKHLFRPKGGTALYLAGLCAEAEGEERFVILTTAPNDSVRDIHDRMPLVLREEEIRPRLTDSAAAMELLRRRPPLLERTDTEEGGQLSLW